MIEDNEVRDASDAEQKLREEESPAVEPQASQDDPNIDAVDPTPESEPDHDRSHISEQPICDCKLSDILDRLSKLESETSTQS